MIILYLWCIFLELFLIWVTLDTGTPLGALIVAGVCVTIHIIAYLEIKDLKNED